MLRHPAPLLSSAGEAGWMQGITSQKAEALVGREQLGLRQVSSEVPSPGQGCIPLRPALGSTLD